MEKTRDRKKLLTFKFSLDPETDSDVILYLQGIKNKNRRGNWITEAVKLYKLVEIELKTTETDEIRKKFKKCLEELKKDSI